MTSEPIRVLIAEDSPTIRYYLRHIIDSDELLEVAGVAGDGEEAIEMVATLKPDVISMDVQMPHMDGLEATRYIMRHHPTPVVVVSGLVEHEVELSFRALQSGALAVVPKPPAHNDARFQERRSQLLNTLQAMADVQVVRRWATVYEVAQPTDTDGERYETQGVRRAPEIIAVAASAGGPSALSTLISGLKNQLNVPMIVVQHMPPEFLPGLVRWLGKFTDLPIRIPDHNDILTPGVIHLAPGGFHLRVGRTGGMFTALLDETPGEYRHQPSADVLFESVAQVTRERGVGIVLTGMGTDGAAGLRAMRDLRARTFAQDSKSAVVFGMPNAAIQLNAAERILPPAQIAATIRKLI